jgi:hypothetical protein
MKLAIMTGVVALFLLGLILELLRRRQLREKYAVLWLAVGLLTLPFGFVPTSLNSLARHLGVRNGASLVLFLAVIFLLLVCIHLSWEASRLEDETRALAEEVALIRTEMRDLKAEVAAHYGAEADSAHGAHETDTDGAEGAEGAGTAGLGANGVRVGIVKPRREGHSPRDAAQDEGALVGEH